MFVGTSFTFEDNKEYALEHETGLGVQEKHRNILDFFVVIQNTGIFWIFLL